MQRRTLPLGIDLGRHRIRVALLERDHTGEPELVAVAARDAAPEPAGALRDALAELGTRERRCVVGLGIPDATLRAIAFPPMSSLERRRAARFEAERFGGDGAVVTLSPLPGHDAWALGIAATPTLERQRTAVAAAGLRAIAVDDVHLALLRAQPHTGGIIDIGAETTRVTLAAEPLPYVTQLPSGGDAFTAAIADALGIDSALAETRKRTQGFAGAGEAHRDALIAAVLAVLDAGQAATGARVRSLALAGNGSRVPGLAETFERATGIPTRLAALEPAVASPLPADVLRAAGPDWALAVGLALWETAR
jgi:Tfp pilus assembly PilM family ATPase